MGLRYLQYLLRLPPYHYASIALHAAEDIFHWDAVALTARYVHRVFLLWTGRALGFQFTDDPGLPDDDSFLNDDVPEDGKDFFDDNIPEEENDEDEDSNYGENLYIG